MTQEQRIVCFSGMVQGVGFRYTACRVANRYDVTGYVRNLRDGRVECVAEGEEREIDAFLTELAEAMRGYIRDRTEQKTPPAGTFASFDVRF